MKQVGAGSSEALSEMVGLLRGRVCDVREVALDDQAGKLHFPIVGGRGSAPAGELVVRGVVEFAVGDIAGLGCFEIDGLAYDDRSGRLSIRSGQVERFRLTVERVDVTLSLS